MLRAFLYLHLSILLAGFTGISARLISLREGVLIWYRLLFSVLFLFLIYGVCRKIPRVDGKSLLRIAGCGALLALHWIFFYGSIKASNVSVGVICFAMIGFFSAFLEPWLLKRKFSFSELGFSLITIAGIAMLFSFDLKFRMGILLGLISTLLAALFTIATKAVGRNRNTSAMLFYEMLGGFCALTLAMPLYLNIFPGCRLIPNGMDLFYLLGLAFFCTLGLYFFQIKALEKISAFTVNLSYNLEPVYSILLAVLIFGEHKEFTPSFYLCFALIVFAVAGQSWRILRIGKSA